jgi:hypothetical protein
MTTSLAFLCQQRRSPDRSAPDQSIDDPQASLQAAVQWHFGPDIGSVKEPTVTNVYSGRQPSYLLAPQIPHDGYLADFLTRNNGFIRD